MRQVMLLDYLKQNDPDDSHHVVHILDCASFSWWRHMHMHMCMHMYMCMYMPGFGEGSREETMGPA